MTWTQRLRRFVRRDQSTADLNDELRFHLDHLIEEHIARGMSPEEARRAAQLEFGGVEPLKEECRSANGLDWLEHAWQDMRLALRNFRRQPGFFLAVAAVIALGIGSSTAVFSVVDRVLFRPQPYSQPGNIVSVGVSFPIIEYDFLTTGTYRELQRDHPPFASVASWSGVLPCDLTEANPQRLSCGHVEASFLPFLGIRPLLGRNFTAEEDRPGAPHVALLTNNVWRSRFGADPAAIGRTLTIDSTPHTIIGILGKDFELPTLDQAEVLLPQALPLPGPSRNTRPVRAFARLKPGVTPARAVEMLKPFYEFIFRTEAPPQYRNEARLRVLPLREFQSGDLTNAAWALFGAVMFILLIASANASGLLLARAAARSRDLAVRAALGAGRGRLLRQALMESAIICLAGAVAGCLLAQGLLRWFLLLAPKGLPHLALAALDLRVLAFALLAALFSALLFGMVPALATPNPALLTGTRVTGTRSLHVRHLLVAVQLAVSLILLSAAGLLLNSLSRQVGQQFGFSPERTVTAEITLPANYRTQTERQAFFEKLEARLRAIPQVRSIAYADTLPPGGVSRNVPYFILVPEGRPAAPRGTGGIVVWRSVSNGYFSALGIPILRGRAFQPEDDRPEAMNIVISQTLARRLFPGEDPVGRRVRRVFDKDWFTVIGVSRDVRNSGLTAAGNPEFYVSRRTVTEGSFRTANFLIRGDAPPAALSSWLRAEVASLEPTIPVVPRTLEDSLGELAARPRFQAALLTLFAFSGLALAAAGLFGLMSFLAAQRATEIGVRLALGATPAQVRQLLLRQALKWTIPGVAAGVAGSLLLGRALRSLLFQVSPADPAIFTAACCVLVAAALLAAYLPARRASAVDPAVTLRAE
ncbi:MAG: ABC transporter permease [Acidobacteria bacterium]|nr:ABC transporter permease [Acidobacteriota bacterium]